ncbi:hypothetical protein GDO86_009573 [Hymenochirus boettgeri]|uniref:Cation-transporting ATPase n=1 Tax=Hymenochirus boettgeri TaxID=247094 RepID=A0A8T2JJG8_9PIPI|nr:hypothetical protein GDO86_009573 [Hymenochirus boettgeri]
MAYFLEDSWTSLRLEEKKFHLQVRRGFYSETEMFGYRTECCRQALCYLGYLLSLGFLRLLFYWKPELHVWCSCIPCSLEEADILLLRTTIRYIQVQKTRFVWNPADGLFRKVLDDNLSCSDIHSYFGSGFSKKEQEIRRIICGLNSVEVEITPIWKLLSKEILNPFYVFEAYSVGTWIATGYLEFSLAILVLTLVSILVSVIMLRMQSIKLNHMVKFHNNVMVTVLHKNGVIEEIPSRYLVPGDVIVLNRDDTYLPCDAILISGGCVTDEGMLTGESVPVTKTPLPFVSNSVPWKIQMGENYKGHVLYCGTKVIRIKPATDGLVKAVVLQTGFNTTKGDLVRSILYPKPVQFQLFKDVLWAMLLNSVVVAAGLTFATVVNVQNGATADDIVVMILLMLAVAIPVTLPPSLNIVNLYCQRRLKKEGIFCISPQRINLCGLVNLVCFDKEVHSFTSGCTLPWSPFLGAMASCHSLIVIDEKLHGDPLDLKMFQGSGWEIEDSKNMRAMNEKSCSSLTVKPGARAQPVPVKGIIILRQFPFSSVLQRMSVITRVVDEQRLTVFMKGAPEKVVSFCNIETVPSDFGTTLDCYTAQGFRVIGLAYKYLMPKEDSVIEKLERDEIETDLVFLGFLILENQLKPETKPVIEELTAANIRTVMLTGDNLQTACTVGINSGLVPKNGKLYLIESVAPEDNVPASITWNLVEKSKQDGNTYDKEPMKEGFITNEVSWDNNRSGKYFYAMSGKSLENVKQYFPNMFSDILLNGLIFARTTPKQKTALVEDLQKIDYCVAMCGDGANDCGALKIAHAGISLSELEASVASPFTSKTANISCVPQLLNEKSTILGNHQYLFQDLTNNLPVVFTMNLNRPAKKLAPYRPAGRLISPPMLPSLAVHFLLSLIVQVSMFTEIQNQTWFNATDVFSGCISQTQSYFNQTNQQEPLLGQNFYSTTFFPLSGINYITLEFVFSRGKPFRQPLYTNLQKVQSSVKKCTKI